MQRGRQPEVAGDGLRRDSKRQRKARSEAERTVKRERTTRMIILPEASEHIAAIRHVTDQAFGRSGPAAFARRAVSAEPSLADILSWDVRSWSTAVTYWDEHVDWQHQQLRLELW